MCFVNLNNIDIRYIVSTFHRKPLEVANGFLCLYWYKSAVSNLKFLKAGLLGIHLLICNQLQVLYVNFVK